MTRNFIYKSFLYLGLLTQLSSFMEFRRLKNWDSRLRIVPIGKYMRLWRGKVGAPHSQKVWCTGWSQKGSRAFQVRWSPWWSIVTRLQKSLKRFGKGLARFAGRSSLPGLRTARCATSAFLPWIITAPGSIIASARTIIDTFYSLSAIWQSVQSGMLWL